MVATWWPCVPCSATWFAINWTYEPQQTPPTLPGCTLLPSYPTKSGNFGQIGQHPTPMDITTSILAKQRIPLSIPRSSLFSPRGMCRVPGRRSMNRSGCGKPCEEPEFVRPIRFSKILSDLKGTILYFFVKSSLISLFSPCFFSISLSD